MITNAINQLLQMTHWGELDYLIVDLPQELQMVL